jgi:hypothetical protein
MKPTLSIVVLFVLVCLALLATDTRVLIWETKIKPGQIYRVEGYGDFARLSTHYCVLSGFCHQAALHIGLDV